MAFATSFAPCAKLRSAAAKTRGIVKRVFTDAFVFFIAVVLEDSFILTEMNTIRATTPPITKAVSKEGFLLISILTSGK